MSLLISKNGKIHDLPKRPNTKKVRSPDEHKVEFEDVLEKEDGHPKQQWKEKEGHSQHHGEGQQSAIKSYQKHKIHPPQKKSIILAREICSQPVISLTPDDKVGDALEKMEKYHIHHLPLIVDGALVGIVSDRDLLDKRHRDRLSQHSRKEVIVAKENTDIKIIARMMLDDRISALPLVNEKGSIIGIITKTDILECVMKNMPFEVYV